MRIVFFMTVAIFLSSCAVEPNLHRSAFWGDLQAAEHEVNAGADVNAVDDNGWTPLYSSVSEGHKDMSVFLIKHGARIDVTDKSGWSIIDEGKFKGQQELVDILLEEQTRRENRYNASVQHFGSLNISDRTTAVYSQWFDKYPLKTRSYWEEPFRSVNNYVRDTEVKYLSSEDFNGTRFGFKPEDVTVTQGKFESDRAHQIRVEQITFEQETRRKNLSQARRLMIADSLQWVMGTFKLENPNYDRSRGIMEFDLVSTTSDFRQRVGAQMNNANLAQSIYKNPGKTQLDVIFKIEDKSYQLHSVRAQHQGAILNAIPLESAVYNLST